MIDINKLKTAAVAASGYPDVAMGPNGQTFTDLASPAAIIEIISRLERASTDHDAFVTFAAEANTRKDLRIEKLLEKIEALRAKNEQQGDPS